MNTALLIFSFVSFGLMIYFFRLDAEKRIEKSLLAMRTAQKKINRRHLKRISRIESRLAHSEQTKRLETVPPGHLTANNFAASEARHIRDKQLNTVVEINGVPVVKG